MASLLLAAAAALSAGTADFLGGIAARRVAPLGVALISQLSGLALILGAVAVDRPTVPAPDTYLWGALAGVTGGGALVLLYRGLAQGRMTALAPTAGVCSMAVPALFGLVLGEKPGPTAFLGICAGVVAVTVLALPSKPQCRKESSVNAKSLGIGVTAGTGIGVFLVCLERAGAEEGLFPLLVARSISAAALLAIAAWRPKRISWVIQKGCNQAIAAGILDAIASGLFLFAVANGLLSVVATVTSLYPTVTVMLAVLFLGESFRLRETVGMILSLASIMLFILG
jgi:uncharacterized membrane protein